MSSTYHQYFLVPRIPLAAPASARRPRARSRFPTFPIPPLPLVTGRARYSKPRAHFRQPLSRSRPKLLQKTPTYAQAFATCASHPPLKNRLRCLGTFCLRCDGTLPAAHISPDRSQVSGRLTHPAPSGTPLVRGDSGCVGLSSPLARGVARSDGVCRSRPYR